MINNELNEREKSVLKSIVQQFILTAAPVGSRNISKKYEIGFSPATVRNVMADLEESGYVNHPHTSAGRVPTDKGYRFYVNSLMELTNISPAQRELINNRLEATTSDPDDILRIASEILSDITHQLACVKYPNFDSGILERIQLVLLSSTRLLIVMSIKSGPLKTLTLEYKSEIKNSQLESVQSLLNERLSGLTLREIRKTIPQRLGDLSIDQQPIIRMFIDSANDIFMETKTSNRLLISGTKNVIKQPEFENPERFQSIIELVEDKDVIIHILEKSTEASGNQIFISIGSENYDTKLSDYSFITKEYKFGDVTGTLGVVGPKRMEYSKIIAIVDYISKIISELLTNKRVK
ncbi:MAG: heat-inducible transcription repressor HrcA [Ignavibacteriaceae bacterium]|nr:heat-inducible transcription repressor HrcA [Ignavibacteriaceae bacterium]